MKCDEEIILESMNYAEIGDIEKTEPFESFEEGAASDLQKPVRCSQLVGRRCDLVRS
jgi:hypothetical protein